MQIWTSREPGDDRLIAYYNQTIYKGNPPVEEIELYADYIRTNNLPSTKIIGIPLNYLKEIRLQEGTNHLEILFGADSMEELKIKDPARRNEVFEYFKTTLPNLVSQTDHYSKFRASKKPLIAMAVLTAIFLYALFFALRIDAGYEFRVSNGASITGIALMLGELGTRNVILIYALLMGIALYFFLNKIKHPPIIHRLTKTR